MPTTSNFGWTTPADTDLVKDGAAAIRTLGNGIDASLVDLKGGTTGQILSKASNTDLDYTWIANDQGDITEVQAGTGISVASGTGPIPVVTNTMATAIDAKGDLVVGTGADTFARLAVGGTNGHTLQIDSSTATGLKWAAAGGGGKVVQVVYAQTSTGASSSSSTYADTNLTASITPTSASNDIYVFVSQCGIIKSSANSANGLNLKLFRGATEILHFARNILYTGTAIQLNGSTASVVYKDSPATTSATTYKTQFASENNTGTVYVNDSSATSTIVLMEVAP